MVLICDQILLQVVYVEGVKAGFVEIFENAFVNLPTHHSIIFHFAKKLESVYVLALDCPYGNWHFVP